MLKKELCMDWEDLFVPPTKVKDYEKINFSSEEIDKFESFFRLDTEIYRAFNRTFWNKITEYGLDEMKKDVKFLKEIYAKCIEVPAACKTSERAEIDYDGREKLEKFDTQDLVKYMVENGADCQWGIIPDLKRQFDLD